MKIAKTALVGACVLGTAISVFVNGQTVKSQAEAKETFTQITAQEMNLLLAYAAEANPMAVKRFEDDPQLRREQIESLRDLLALASEAQKVGLADRKEFRNELENIAAEVTAISYDRRVNKRRSPFENQRPFEKITDAMVARYWDESPGSPLSAPIKTARNAKFEQFLDTKLYILGTDNPDLKGKPLSDNERTASRGMYARTQIYADEYAKRSALLPLSFKQKVRVQIKLQQAQFLARLYAKKVAADTVVSDTEIETYIKVHPELDTAGQRAKAEKILARAKSGEDFAKLANEFTEDPGNKSATTGQLQGGLYKSVNLGIMVPPFEKAAMALEAGEISPDLVETDFGYHIVKLESKSGDKYDVRHILIATGVGDFSNPFARSVPVKEYVKKKLENEKERVIIDRIVAANKISVPEDFVVPRVVIPGEAPKTTPKAKPRATRKRT